MIIKPYKKNRLIIVVILFYSLIGTGCMKNKLLKLDAESIRHELLQQTPIGTSLNDVEKNLKSKGLSPRVSLNTGFSKREKGSTKVVGSQFIRASLGEYRSSLFFITSVSVYWGFDENGKLIEIWVWKTQDGP